MGEGERSFTLWPGGFGPVEVRARNGKYFSG